MRAFRKALPAAIMTIGMIATPVAAQMKPGPVVLTPHPLKGGAYWVEGGTANTGFVVGDKGVVVIDAQRSTDDGRKALAVIAGITPKPVTAVIVTHGDPDHIGGLPAYPAGIQIIEHENTRAAVLAAIADPNGGPVNSALYKTLATGFMPTRTIAATEAVVIDGVRMQLIHVAPGHSSGDIFVYLPAQKIVFGGDLILTNTGRFPIIHIGGSSLGWIEAVTTMLALDADTYISGHGGLETKAQLRARLADVTKRRADIKAMVNAGKTLDEVNQALPETVVNKMFPTFNATTYDELTKGYPAAVAPWLNIVGWGKH